MQLAVPRRRAAPLALGLVFALAPSARAQTDTLSVAEREDHSPYLTAQATGAPSVIWIASAPDTNAAGPFDEVAVAERGPGGWGAPEIIGGPAQIMGPRLVYGETGRRWAVWAEHDGTDSQVRLRWDQGGQSGIFTLGDAAQPDFEPSICAVPGDSILVVWQGWRSDNYEILLSVGDNNGMAAPIVISTCARSDREPRVVWGDDRAWIVWSAYEGEPYNLHHATWSPSTGVSPVVRLTDSFRARNLHPELHWDDANHLLWIISTWVNRGWTGFNNTEWPALWDPGSPRIRAFDGTQISAPLGLNADDQYPLAPMEDLGYTRFLYTDGQVLPDRWGTGVALAGDSSGRLWCFHKQTGSIDEHGTTNMYWAVVGLHYSAAAWSAPDEFLELRTSIGWEIPAVVASADTLWNAWAADNRSPSIVDSPQLNLWGHDMQIVVRATPQPPQAPVAPTLTVIGSPTPPPAVPPEVRIPFTIEHAGTTLALRWGDNHRHSHDMSWDGTDDPPIKHTLFYSLDWLGHDWITPSDHCERFSKAIWGWVRRFAMFYDVPGRFRVFPGYERAMRGGAGGDQNATYRDPADFTEATAELPDISSWHHLYAAQSGIDVLDVPHTTAQCGAVADWDHLANGNPTQLPAPLRLMEVYQSARQSFEYPGCPHQFTGCVASPDSGWISAALAKGLRIGIISASDHTIRAAFTGVYAVDLTRQGIWDGLQARRTFGTTRTRKANVVFTIGGALMGSETESAVAPQLAVRVAEAVPPLAIHVNKDGNPDWTIITSNAADTTVTIADPDPFTVGTSSYYYVRIDDLNDKHFYTSPIWVDFVSPAPTGAVEPTPAPDRFGIRPFPNPGRGQVSFALDGLAEAGGVVRIHDLQGRLVREFRISGGRAEATPWDGRDGNGSAVASGRFFAVFRSGGRTGSCTFTFLR